MIQIEYKVKRAGWANGKIGNGEKTTEFVVSYLHDSLKALAESAIKIYEKEAISIVFMDEPGEHILVLYRKDEKVLDYELRWYKDWWSWNLIEEDNFELIFSGQTTIARYVNQVRNVLIEIMNELGVEEYKKKWIEHDFPLAEYEKLK